MSLKLQRIGCTLTHRPLIPSSLNLKHVGTELQLSYSSDFTSKDDIIPNPNGYDGRHVCLETDGVDITAPYTDVEVDTDRIIYVRYRILMDSTLEPTGTIEYMQTSEWSRISSTEGTDIYTLTGLIISTPSVFMEQTTGGVLEDQFKFIADGFKNIKGDGAHVSTSWIVEDGDGEILFKRMRDTDNKYSILLPTNMFSGDKIYIIKAKFHNELGGESNFGSYTYNPNISVTGNFELKPVLPFAKYQDLYFRFMLLKPNIVRLGIIIKENRYDSEVEVYRNENFLPKTSIRITDANLVVGRTYKVYAFCTVNNGGYTYNTALTKTCEFTYQDPTVYPLLSGTDYPQLYGDLGRVSTGNVIVNTVEFKNGLFVMAGNSANKLCLYGKYGKGIMATKIEFELPFTAGEVEDDDNVVLPYINVLPMYNNMFAINYSIFNRTNYRRSFWAFYTIDLVNNEVTLAGTKEQSTAMFADEYLSTAISSSAVVGRDNTIYYIPAGYVPTNEFEDLPMFSIRYTGTEIIRTKVLDVVKPGIKRHMTMCPRNTEVAGNEDFIILGGTTDEEFNEIDSDGYLLEGVTYFKLSNKDIFNFNTSRRELTKIGELGHTGEEELDFPVQVYNLAAYRRADGKIVIFNNSNNGDYKYDSSTYLLDLDDLTPDSTIGAVKENNDTRVDIPFRSTIRMTNGDFVRLSYVGAMYNQSLLYSSQPLLNYTDAEIAINKNLVVKPGEVIAVENMYLYETVTIQGSSLNDTGIIRWTDKNVLRVLDFRHRIFTRDATLTKEEQESIPAEFMVVLTGVTVRTQ